MANVFSRQKSFDNKPKRNNFDLSNQNHLTMDFGKIYPFLCIPAVPGDSFELDSAIGLKFQPLTFPVQTRMRAHVSYFKVPLRILWDRYKDWLTGLYPDLVHPYIKQGKEFFKTGTLADYLGVPTSIVSNSETPLPLTPYSIHSVVTTSDGFTSSDMVGTTVPELFKLCYYGSELTRMLYPMLNRNFDYSSDQPIFNGSSPLVAKYYGSLSPVSFPPSSSHPILHFVSPSSSTQRYKLVILGLTSTDVSFSFEDDNDAPIFNQWANLFDGSSNIMSVFNYEIDPGVVDLNLSNPDLNGEVAYDVLNDYFQRGYSVYIGLFYPAPVISELKAPTFMQDASPSSLKVYRMDEFSLNSDIYRSLDSSEIGTPFSDGSICLNALPFRAYEAICNAYYRNTQVDPFKIDGVNEYNRFVTNDKAGADDTPYELFSRNWYLDTFTSALPSPQQGPAPLIGMSNLNTMQITDEDGNVVDYHVTTSDDGQTIVKLSATSANASVGSQRIAMDVAKAGITVNDIRNVNSLQRWLETNIRKGYHYKDFISGHHGVSPTGIELNMPEFLGGYTRDVNVDMVQNMAAGDAVLGDYAGTASLFSGSSRKIYTYCDDYSYIIGLISVVPDPVYSQMLPKDFLKHAVLDYYFPEFVNLGMQPITYEEVTPLQRWLEHSVDENNQLQDTFGYQRPNYDMIYRPDEAHGQFRTDMSNYLIHRVFSNSPVLGREFIQTSSDDARQIFTIQEGHPIIGQIINSVFAKRPVPRVSIPRLE